MTFRSDRLGNLDWLGTYRYTPSRSKRSKTRRLSGTQFVRGFVQHTLPRGFQKVRYYGWTSPNSRIRLDVLAGQRHRPAGTCRARSRIDRFRGCFRPPLRVVSTCSSSLFLSWQYQNGGSNSPRKWPKSDRDRQTAPETSFEIWEILFLSRHERSRSRERFRSQTNRTLKLSRLLLGK